MTRVVSPAATTSGTTKSGSSRNASANVALGLGLEPVVELLLGAGLHLGDQRLHVDARDQAAHGAGQPGELAQVGAERVAGAGVLDLHRDLAAVVPAALVHLADRRGRGRAAVEPDQLLLPVRRRGRGRAPRGPAGSASAAPSPGAWSAARGRAPAISSGSAASSTESAWPNFIAPPLSSPRVRKSCSAVRCWMSDITASAGCAADPLAEPERAAPGVPDRQGGEPRRPRHGLAGQLGHASSVPNGPNGCRAARAVSDPLRATPHAARWADEPLRVILGVLLRAAGFVAVDRRRRDRLRPRRLGRRARRGAARLPGPGDDRVRLGPGRRHPARLRADR